MDAKLSARSKHASSQRGRARHANPKHSHKPLPNQQQNPSSDTASSHRKAPALPSNWSRYEDEDLPEAQSLPGLPAVKSTGADYRELLSRQSLTSRYENTDLPGGRISLMLTRGLNLWASGLDADSFWNKSAEEESFLSLDMDFLGNELVKIDLAERLLIDPDFIEAEKEEKSFQCDDEPITEAQDNSQGAVDSIATSPGQTIPDNSFAESSSASKMLSGDVSQDSPISEAGHELDDVISTRFINDTLKVQPQNPMSMSVGREGLQKLGKGTDQKETTVYSQNPGSIKFEAKAAEAELDALLEMLDNDHVGDSAIIPSGTFSGSIYGQGSSSADAANGELPRKDVFTGSKGDAFLDTLTSSNVGYSGGIFLDSKENARRGAMSGAVPSGQTLSLSMSDNGKGTSSLTEDFDDWLDSF